jgi:hypothetical protein
MAVAMGTRVAVVVELGTVVGVEVDVSVGTGSVGAGAQAARLAVCRIKIQNTRIGKHRNENMRRILLYMEE